MTSPPHWTDPGYDAADGGPYFVPSRHIEAGLVHGEAIRGKGRRSLAESARVAAIENDLSACLTEPFREPVADPGRRAGAAAGGLPWAGRLGLLVGPILREPGGLQSSSLFLNGAPCFRAALFEQSLFPEQSFGSLTGFFCFVGHGCRGPWGGSDRATRRKQRLHALIPA